MKRRSQRHVPRRMPRHLERGFTLVEIMAVVFIVGLMIGLAAITIGGHSDRLMENEVQRLFQKIRLASEEAENSNSEYGMGPSNKNGYQFYRFDEQLMSWKKVDDGFFKSVELDEGYKLLFDTSETPLDLSKFFGKVKSIKGQKFGDKEQDSPKIIFLSDGQTTPFKLTISNRNLSKKIFVVSSNAQSQLSMDTNDK